MEKNKKAVVYLAIVTAGYIVYIAVWGIRGEFFIYMTAAFTVSFIMVVASALGFIKPPH